MLPTMGRAGPPDVNLQRAISHQGSTTEPLPYPVAILGAGVGLVLLAFFFIQIGMTIGVAVIFLAIYLMVAIVITRMRSEAGIFVHNFHYTSPVFFFTDAIGKSTKDPVLACRHLESEAFAGGSLAVANHLAGFCSEVTLW